MATYTAQEVQQMREGGNGAFSIKYLAKWNSSSFPAPVDKNPKKVEEFIKQVLVDKVFYSETAVENRTETMRQPSVASPMLTTTMSSRSLMTQMSSRSMKVENSWQAFSEDKPASTVRSVGASAGANWAEFKSAPAAKPAATQPFDAFASTSPVRQSASPKSVHSTPADPFTSSKQAWDPFSDTSNGAVVQPSNPVSVVQTGWSQFETKTDGVPLEKAAEAQAPASTPNGTTKKTTVLDPLPEEWFSAPAQPAPAPQYTFPVQGTRSFQPMQHQQFAPQQPFVQQQPFAQPGAFGAFQQGSTMTAPHPSALGYNQQAPQASLGGFASFHPAAGMQQQWPQQNFAMLQKQDSIASSYVSHRVDDPSRNPLFQNLDMDMRGKAHSVAGVPVQPPANALFGNATMSPTGFNHTGTAAPFQPSFFQPPPQTGFDEANGNPFA